jgi:hypothetical protein
MLLTAIHKCLSNSFCSCESDSSSKQCSHYFWSVRVQVIINLEKTKSYDQYQASIEDDLLYYDGILLSFGSRKVDDFMIVS